MKKIIKKIIKKMIKSGGQRMKGASANQRWRTVERAIMCDKQSQKEHIQSREQLCATSKTKKSTYSQQNQKLQTANYQTTKLPNYQTTKLPNYQTIGRTSSPNHIR